MSIAVRGLTKAFGPTTVVNGIDITVGTGEMVVLLGPSGCGKTTTMRCIAGLETPTSGTIVIGDRVVYDGQKKIDVAVEDRHVGMVFQSYAIWPHMSVFDNVAFPLSVAGTPAAETRERVREMLELVGLSAVAGRGASYLSGGQMQRVALARSLVMRPAVLLLDEPLSNLDARLRDRLRMLLRELQTQFKITSVYVTHDQHEALSLADRIVVLQAGSVLQVDEPMAIYRAPKSRTVAEFIGYSNIFDAAVAAADGFTVTLAANGARLQTRQAPPAGSREVAVCVRPNDVRLEPGGAPGTAALPPNVLAGTVVLASFEGSHVHYRVRCGEQLVWDVFRTDPAPGVRAGSAVLLSIAPEHVLVVANA